MPGGFGGRMGCLSRGRSGLGGGQLHGHLLRGRVGLRTPLVGLGGTLLGGGRAGLSGGRTLLSSRTDGFDLGLSGGRVSHYVDGLAQPVCDTSDPIGLGA
jgi:hypothetical protein